MSARSRLTALAATGAAAIAIGSGVAVSANAATAPHNTYSYSHTSSATAWTTTQTWHQYQTSTTYNEEQVTDHGTSTGAGYHKFLYKQDRAGKWTAHLTGRTWTAKRAVTWLNTWTHN